MTRNSTRTGRGDILKGRYRQHTKFWHEMHGGPLLMTVWFTDVKTGKKIATSHYGTDHQWVGKMSLETEDRLRQEGWLPE